MLCAGTGLLQPDIRLDAGILALPSEQQRAIGRRLTDWLDAQKQRHLRPLLAMAQQSRDAAIAPPLRAVLAQLADAGGILPRNMLDDALAHLDKARSEEHTSELQSLMRISYSVFCLKKKKENLINNH